MRVCKGACKLETTLNLYEHMIATRRYSQGMKKCRLCSVFWKDIRCCPCCGTILASGPKNNRCKRKYNTEEMYIE